MKLPNGYGSVVKLSDKRRTPYLIRKTNSRHFDKEKDKQVQDFIILGYAPTRAEGFQMLADYNKNPFYKAWFEDNPEYDYLIHTPDGKHFQYKNYYDSYFHPLMEQPKIDHTPHCCRPHVFPC